MTTLLALAVLAAPTVGSPAPAFSLPSVEGKTVSLADLKGKYVVLEWHNKDCPYVRGHYERGGMQATQAEAKKFGAVWLTLCSSAPGKQGYMTADEYKGYIKSQKMNSADVLLDPDGKVGKLYNAKTTPQIVIVDPKGTMIYNGAIDNAQTNSPTPKVNYALQALTEATSGKAVSVPTSRPYGCGVKYKD
ncbi:redoxin domain-containing protein [bacterium]|nr:MAG: redoxin domain-containing protein [bacterium]